MTRSPTPIACLADDAERYGAWQLGPAYRTIFPVPLGGDASDARFAFLLARAEMTVIGRPPTLFAPSAVINLRASDGLVLDVRRIAPADFGLAMKVDEPLGFEEPMGARLSDEGLAARARAYAALDALAPVFFGAERCPEEEVRTRVIAFRGAFDRAVESPLLPFLRVIARRFFAWMEHR
ncbi:MAG: hypothetical protein AB7S26_22765 [Sandaracinaceae bacterium]